MIGGKVNIPSMSLQLEILDLRSYKKTQALTGFKKMTSAT